MQAEYNLKRNTLPTTDGSERNLYPSLIITATADENQLAENISKTCSFTPADVKGVLSALTSEIAYYLGNGYNVKLDNIGTFSVSLTATTPITNADEVDNRSIEFSHVNFRTAPELLNVIKRTGGLKKSAKSFHNSSTKYTAKQRKAMLMKYLEKNHFITRKQYSHLTGLLKTQATKELNQLLEEKIIGSDGGGSHKIYTR